MMLTPIAIPIEPAELRSRPAEPVAGALRHPAADAGPPIDWPAMRRILAVRPDNLGDVVLATPAIRALQRAAPSAAVDLLASPAGSAAARLCPYVTGIITTSPVWQDVSGAMPQAPRRQYDLIRRLRMRGYDTMVVFTSFSQSPWPAAYVGYLAGIPVRVGHSREFGGSVLSHWVTPPPDDVHQVDRCLHLLAAVGVPSAGRHLELVVPARGRRSAARALQRAGLLAGEPYALLAPGATCSARRYDPKRFACVAAQVADAGLPVVVTGAARERPLVESVVGAASRPQRVVGVTSVDVRGFSALVSDAEVVICNNSGSMHLADALGTPVVCTWSGTEAESQLRPRNAEAILLRVPTPCAPCHQFRCPYALQCLDITPAMVTEAVLRLAFPPSGAVTCSA